MIGGLPDSTVKKIRVVLSGYPQVDEATLYGSRAKGNYKNGSDIDLTLSGGEDLSFDVMLKIMTDLDDLFIPYVVDLSIFRDIHDLDLIEHIKRLGVTFYKKDRKEKTIEP